jgi:hypothetical protein
MRIGTIGWIVIGIVIYNLVKLIIEANRDAKLARVKADLKLRLLERVQDPELLRDILDKDLDLSPEGLDLHKEAWDRNREQAMTSPKCRDRGWAFVIGMISFFMGIGVILLSIMESGSTGDDALTGGICLLVLGWVLLGWHVYSQERKGERSRNPEDLDEGRTSS